MEKIIKFALAIFLLLCVLDMPYGYYQLVRWLALVGFAVLAYKSYESHNNVLVIVYFGLSVLFQPIFKISLGREIWNVVDVVVGIGLVASVISDMWHRKRGNRQI